MPETPKDDVFSSDPPLPSGDRSGFLAAESAGYAPDSVDSIVANRRPVDWNAVASDNRVILLGDHWSNRLIRDFLTDQAKSMQAAGITHFGIETPSHPAFDELNAGRTVDLTRVEVCAADLGYKQTIQAMHDVGITIVPLGLDQTLPLAAGDRDRHMADTITQLVSHNPHTKVAALLGSFHTSNFQQDFGPTAGAILHAGPHPTTSIAFTGGSENVPALLTRSAQRNNAAGETFFVDLRDYHAAGGVVCTNNDAVIHLPQSFRGGHPDERAESSPLRSRQDGGFGPLSPYEQVYTGIQDKHGNPVFGIAKWEF